MTFIDKKLKRDFALFKNGKTHKTSGKENNGLP